LDIDDDTDSDNEDQEIDEELKVIDYKKAITTGSFLPVVTLLSKGLV
jgi:hypothetical protein